MAPLTEREKSQLRLLETQLHTDDPKFVKRMRTKHSLSLWHRPQARNLLLVAIGMSVGIIGLIGGIMLTPLVGIPLAGQISTLSLILLLAIYLAFWDDIGSALRVKTQRFMANLEVKWEERKRDEGFSQP